MKLRHLALSVAFLLNVPAFLVAGEASAATAAGYWAGSVTLPNQELAVSVELAPSNGSAWQGTIDIPLQGMRGFKLDAVKVEGANVEFAMPGIPGEPRFTGKLASDGKTISGDFAQGGGSMPFRLERKTKPAPEAREAVPARGVAGKGLAGKWLGAISPLPNMELRLALELTANANGKVEGVMVSLDQGSPRIPLSGVTETEGKVQFETPAVNGAYTGKFNADGSEITGEWSQGGRSTPLVFKRLPAAAGR